MLNSSDSISLTRSGHDTVAHLASTTPIQLRCTSKPRYCRRPELNQSAYAFLMDNAEATGAPNSKRPSAMSGDRVARASCG
jgi:hypothetical protein